VACEEAIEQARSRFAAFEKPTHSSFATFRYLRAVSLMERNEAVKARPLLEESVKMFDAATDRNPIRVRAYSLLAVALDATGEAARAREMAELAVSTARDMTTGLATSEWVGTALLMQAQIHEKQGDVEGARAMVKEARKHLEATVGMEAPV